MLLALFLLELAAGTLAFLPLVGRRNSGVKFYRLIILFSLSLAALAGISHALAGRRDLAMADGALAISCIAWFIVLRYPKRLVHRLAAIAVGVCVIVIPVVAWHEAIRPASVLWSIAGAMTGAALLGSVNLAMLLGHWYLVVRGMAIEPLLRLVTALIASSVARLLVTLAAIALLAADGWGFDTPLHDLFVRDGLFFWMRVGWGLLFPLALWPMVHGTAKIRSTMAATGILYVDVVGIVIGELLAVNLALSARLPV
ncbi:MAG TPA: hypothetical protein VM557_09665 [Thermoanaerobaculia bacterium]|nr:hypothetical protein [Thermoanaerobaculia bacterium]